MRSGFGFQGSRVVLGVVLSLLVAGASSRASAQSLAEPKTWTISPFVGSTTGVDAAPGGGNSMVLGVGVGYDLTSNVGFEGEFGHLFDIAGSNETVDWAVTNVSANFIYHFDVMHVTPYATFGLGLERSGLDGAGVAALQLESSTEVAFNLGGGVKYQLTPKLLLRGDLRHFQSNDLAPDYWRVYAGLTFRLGR